MSEEPRLKDIVEAALVAAGEPLTVSRLLSLFPEDEQPDRNELRAALEEIGNDYEGRAIELKEVASGFRFQVRQHFSPWISRLWEERPGRYSRALMETLALIAYRQPITRGEIEEVRGVAVSTNIVRTLLERDWVHVVGHREVPGRPALYGTTRGFLDYFNLKGLDELPVLTEIRDIDADHAELELALSEAANESAEPAANDAVNADPEGEPMGPSLPGMAAGDEPREPEEAELPDIGAGDELAVAVDETDSGASAGIESSSPESGLPDDGIPETTH